MNNHTYGHFPHTTDISTVPKMAMVIDGFNNIDISSRTELVNISKLLSESKKPLSKQLIKLVEYVSDGDYGFKKLSLNLHDRLASIGVGYICGSIIIKSKSGEATKYNVKTLNIDSNLTIMVIDGFCYTILEK